MSKKKIDQPDAPEFQAEQNVQPNINQLSDLGGRLTSFDFGGELSPLQDTIDLDPEVTRLALDFAQNSLSPAFNRTRQNTINELANLGSLTSSTTSNAFAQQDFDLNQQFQAITSQAALADRERALGNRLNLFGTGLNTLESATGLGLNQQTQLNAFEQQKFENQIALNELNRDTSGGLVGGLTGAIGGGLAGFSIGGPYGAIAGALGGGLAGGFGPQGTGGQFLNAGSMLGASSLKAAKPGSTAGAGRKLLSRGQTVQTPTGPMSLLDDINFGG